MSIDYHEEHDANQQEDVLRSDRQEQTIPPKGAPLRERLQHPPKSIANHGREDNRVHQQHPQVEDRTRDGPKEQVRTHPLSYDQDLKNFIKEFNIKNKKQFTLLDFSQYSTEFGDLKNEPLKKEDVELLKEFQKRKVDQRIAEIQKKYVAQN